MFAGLFVVNHALQATGMPERLVAQFASRGLDLTHPAAALRADRRPEQCGLQRTGSDAAAAASPSSARRCDARRRQHLCREPADRRQHCQYHRGRHRSRARDRHRLAHARADRSRGGGHHARRRGSRLLDRARAPGCRYAARRHRVPRTVPDFPRPRARPSPGLLPAPTLPLRRHRPSKASFALARRPASWSAHRREALGAPAARVRPVVR